jgi:ATP-dependent Clp protease ATP-binding subunit ClpB
MEKHAVARLIGAPPGYVGYEEGGQLTEAVRRKPYAVVLFDEIEKAHGDVFNVLLQLLDDGRLTDSQGRVVNFKNTIVIMTSNIAAAQVAGLDNQKEIDSLIQDALRRHFRPEFLNRIDDIIVFHRLGIKELKKVVDIQVATLAERLKAKGIKLELTDKAKDLLGRQGYDPVYGARPLRRVIQKLLQDPIALRLLQGELKEGQTLTVEAQGNDLVIDT